MSRKKHLSHGAPPGAAVLKRGELFEVVFSRRDKRFATFGETAADAAAKAWRFWSNGEKSVTPNPTPNPTRFGNLLTNALK